MKRLVRGLFLIFSSCFLLLGCQDRSQYVNYMGTVLGKPCKIVYKTPDEAIFSFEISVRRTLDRAFVTIDNSISARNSKSILCNLNANKSRAVDSIFTFVFNTAEHVSTLTGGALDVTIEPLYKLWGSQLENRITVTERQVEEALRFTGMDKAWIVDYELFKADPNIQINMNALAGGCCADYAADVLRQLGVKDFMVDVNGDVVCQGVNPNGAPWRFGIIKSHDIIYLENKALSTSGSFLNFNIKDRELNTCVFDPYTGYPVTHNLLSVTVIAERCIIADAFSTAFMVMGLERSIAYIKEHPELAAIFTFDDNGVLGTYATENIAQQHEIQYIP